MRRAIVEWVNEDQYAVYLYDGEDLVKKYLFSGSNTVGFTVTQWVRYEHVADERGQSASPRALHE